MEAGKYRFELKKVDRLGGENSEGARFREIRDRVLLMRDEIIMIIGLKKEIGEKEAKPQLWYRGLNPQKPLRASWKKESY